MQKAIELKAISKKFKHFTAVNELSLSVNEGEIYGFLGPNGSGKSTTLRMMMGLIKPTSGEITLFNKSLKEERSVIMQQVGCMIEKPDFYGYLTAKENLQLFARANLLSLKQKDYNNLFEMVGLLGREKDKVKTFSHGMKQRLGLAQTLIHDPSLIILDEPNTGLDPQGIIDLRLLMIRLNKERNKTIIFSSHILNEVQEICTSMVVINKGKSVVEGQVADLLSHERLHVALEVTDLEKLITKFKDTEWESSIEKVELRELKMNMSKEKIPQMVRDINAWDIGILRIDYKNQLEEYFLKITQE
jgi:ABC-type multidrug transport system ATPase subunit